MCYNSRNPFQEEPPVTRIALFSRAALLLCALALPTFATRVHAQVPARPEGSDTAPAPNASNQATAVIATATALPADGVTPQLYEDAIKAYKAGHLSEAAAKLEDVIKAVPANPDAHSLLGFIYLKQNKTADAAAQLATVVKLSPGNVAARSNLANADLQLGKTEDAISEFKEVLARSPKDTNAAYGLALAEGKGGHLDEFIAAFQQVIAVKPTAAAYQNLGVVLQQAKRSNEAADAFQQAATLEPSNGNAFLNAGLLYAQSGQNDKAITDLAKAISLDTDYKYEAHMALAQAYAGSKDNAKAISEFTIASQVRPTEAAPLFDLGVLQSQAGSSAAAADAYRKVIALPAADPTLKMQAQTNLALLSAKSGSADAATALAQAAQTDPNNPAPHTALANLYAKQGDVAKALAERRTVLKLSPTDDQTRLLVADTLLSQKEYSDAASQYDVVAQREPKNAAVQNARGTAYELSGDLSTAQRAFEAALAIDPKNAQAENNLGVVYEKQGKKAQAIAAYKKAIALDPTLVQAKKNLARYSAKK